MSNRFKKHSGCYTCRLCGKRTRETGDEESSVRLCRNCNRTVLRENYHSDNSHEGDVETCPLCGPLDNFNLW